MRRETQAWRQYGARISSDSKIRTSKRIRQLIRMGIASRVVQANSR